MHDRIRVLREALNLSQREFGEKLGVSRNVISNLEYSRVPPKELLLRHICELYGVNEDWLISGKGEMLCRNYVSDQNLTEALEIFKSLQPIFQDYALEQIRQLAALQAKL